MSTAAVQLGTRSQTGIISEKKAGTNAQCQPTSATIAIPTTTSRASFKGETQPPTNSGRSPSCTASATTPRTRAALTRFVDEIDMAQG